MLLDLPKEFYYTEKKRTKKRLSQKNLMKENKKAGP